MSSDKQQAWKEAARKKRKEAGHYDGRFAPKTHSNPRHEAEKYKCREEVEVPEDVEEDFDDLDFSFGGSENEETPDEWNEKVESTAFESILSDE